MKRYEDLDITDNFMFAKVFSNEDVAKDFLQDILKITIEKIEVVTEASAQEDPFHKSVRFDVLVREEPLSASESASELKSASLPKSSGNPNSWMSKTPKTASGTGRYFDIELQMDDTGELPKRARYYQGMCDLDALGKGRTTRNSRSNTFSSSARRTSSGRASPSTGSRTARIPTRAS